MDKLPPRIQVDHDVLCAGNCQGIADDACFLNSSLICSRVVNGRAHDGTAHRHLGILARRWRNIEFQRIVGARLVDLTCRNSGTVASLLVGSTAT